MYLTSSTGLILYSSEHQEKNKKTKENKILNQCSSAAGKNQTKQTKTKTAD